MKKFVVGLLGMLLLALPLLGVPAQEASAASSRVAVIQELKGTVKVKKSGGSKEFTAFAKMSLNEGDILTVGTGGSAVLQFANGTSEDDKMAVSANTTLTFSKLKEGKNTVTKVSVQNGSVWSTVKSIKNAGDQFTLETPTAVMGVRGTNLFVSVDPVTGDARFVIASGVGQVSPTNTRAGTPSPVAVYPSQQVTIDDRDETNEFPDEVVPVDLSALANNISADVLAAILQAKNEIDRENEEFIQKKREELQSGQNDPAIGLDTQADLDRLIQNLNYLVGNVLQEALRNNKIDQEQLQGLIDEANRTLTNKIDLANTPPPILTENEKRKAEQIKKQEEARLEAIKKQKEAEQQSRLEELVKKVEAEKKKLEEANQKALEEAKKKAKEEYEKKLSEAEKQRFAEASKSREEELQNRTTPSPSTVPSPPAGGGGGSSGGGSSSGGGTNPTPVAPFGLYFKSAASPEIQENFTYSASQTHYSFNVQDHVQDIVIKRNSAASSEIIYVKYSSQSECGLGEGTDYCYEYVQGGIGGYVVPLAPGSNSIVIETTTSGGSSGMTREFTLDINKSETPAGILGWNVEIPMEEYGLEWQVTGIDRYALDLNEYFDSYPISELEMGLELAPGITKAELTYETKIQDQPQSQTVTWTDSGVQTIHGLTEGYLHMTLDLYAETTKKYSKELWIINGETDVNDLDHPFYLIDNQNRDVHYESSYEDVFGEPWNEYSIHLTASLYEEATGITISEISDAAEPSMRLQSVSYNGSEYFASNGSVQLNLNSESEFMTVYATDPSGLYPYEYELEVIRMPAGITSWKLYYAGPSANLRKVPGADKYYVMGIPEFELPEQMLIFDVIGTGSVSLKRAGETINGDEQTPEQGQVHKTYILNQHVYLGINVFDLEITNEGSSRTYEIVLNIGDVSQRELVELQEQQSQNPSQISWNGQYLETTVSSSSVSLYLGTDPRYARVVAGDTEIPAEDGEYPLSLDLGENIVQIWIQNPITLEEETIILKIMSMTGQV